ncbi:MAG: GNAT family N-acetyltransferase [Cytophagales bacterium]|nr:GNAT family N-acetyltransferase [Armatimonadota bacterium]
MKTEKTEKTDLTSVTIRPFDRNSEADYEALAALQNIETPEMPVTASEIRYRDEQQPAHLLSGRFLAQTAADTILGVSDYGQWLGMYHPRRFWGGVLVHPDCRRQGIGTRLYDALLERLAPHDPLSLRAVAREDKPDANAFLEKRGYAPDMRFWESVLQVAAFDPAPYQGAIDRFVSEDFTIRSYADLANDPDRDRRLYEMVEEVHQDVPSPEARTPVPFDEWIKRLDSPNFLPDANFVALGPDGTYLGITMLWKRQATDQLQTGLTGVRAAYRRKGIALALKLRAIEYARSMGAPSIRTDNESNNRGMLSINEALGFVKDPVWVVYVKTLSEEKEPPV